MRSPQNFSIREDSARSTGEPSGRVSNLHPRLISDLLALGSPAEDSLPSCVHTGEGFGSQDGRRDRGATHPLSLGIGVPGHTQELPGSAGR